MIALDTNVLLRYLLKDDEEQTPRAVAFIRGTADRDEKLFLSHVVLCEVTWVLKAACSLPKPDIVEVLKNLIRTAQFVVEEPDLAARALNRYEVGRADFADYIIAERSNEAGCEQVATFDKKLLKEDGFIRP